MKRVELAQYAWKNLSDCRVDFDEVGFFSVQVYIALKLDLDILIHILNSCQVSVLPPTDERMDKISA